ncbi:MAG: N-acetylneuraminate synthase family protein [Rhodospirillum sp.]|nr:N-acetylneuraminate synthase family protein [Rhodospirillum sp.]
MDLFGVTVGLRPLVIAEAGVNHEGDPEAALRLVALAAEVGADAIKFQSFTPERFVAASDGERLARVRRFGLNGTTHDRLAAAAKERGIALFSTAVSEDWIPFLSDRFPVLKIASGDIDFAPVLIPPARSGRPTILSTGCADMDEVERAVTLFGKEIGDADLGDRLMLMHCVSAYPTPMEEANLRAIPALRARFGLPVGWSNHVMGADACIAAVALGADVVEVHFTETRENRTFRDHALSFEPRELADLVGRLRAVHQGLGDGKKTPRPCEVASRAALRKGIVASRDLAAGTLLTLDDLAYARPATGFFSHEVESLAGHRLTEAVAAGHPIPRDAVV